MYYSSVYDYFNVTTGEKCDLFADLFKLSVEKGYASVTFVKDLLSNPAYKFFVVYDECQEWCDEYYLLDTFERKRPFKKGGTADPFDMWFMGFTYKLWIRERGAEPEEVIKILPVEWFLTSMGMYHTEDFDYVINHAIEHKDTVDLDYAREYCRELGIE